MSPEKRDGVEFTRARAQRGQAHWFHRIRRHVRDTRGIALVTVLYIVFTIGMMLFAFGFMMQGEASFAALNRNSTIALSLAEAGIQEAIQRLSMTAVTPGTTTFTNSLAAGNTVSYQLAVQNNPQLFPILSVATYAGTQRAVRIYERKLFKAGFSNVVEVPQTSAQSNFTDMKGDMYSLGSISFQSNAIQCGSGATATNLVPSQVLAGTTISGQGAAINPGCGATSIGSTFTYECSSAVFQQSEVAPTPCTRTSDAGGNLLPVHYHPMVPVGMDPTDFATVMTTAVVLPSVSVPNVSVVQATQNNGVQVSYTPAGSTPSYWGSVRAPAGRVQVIVATSPFCVSVGAAAPQVVNVSPPVSGGCPLVGTWHRYGFNNGASGSPQRFIDWGLVQDDNSRTVATTFFQAPACTAPCANPGNQNGIRYIPLVPSLNMQTESCKEHYTPGTGTNVFDNLNSDPACTDPNITQISTTTVTFSGTKSNPEALVIDNPTQTVTITGSLPGSGLTCASNFDSYNWGMILASGSLSIPADFVLSGFIFASGNITAQSNLAVTGGVFSPTGPSSTQLSATLTANVTFCGGQAVTVTTPLFYNFSTLSWMDRPGGKP